MAVCATAIAALATGHAQRAALSDRTVGQPDAQQEGWRLIAKKLGCAEFTVHRAPKEIAAGRKLETISLEAAE